MKKITLLVGVPCSGKSHVASQLGHKFEHIAHDSYIGGNYVQALLKASEGDGGKPILAEAPFSVNDIMEPLKAQGRDVTPVFIIEHDMTLLDRYHKREGKVIPARHLKRQDTYKQRAQEHKAFSGTSQEVMEHLK